MTTRTPIKIGKETFCIGFVGVDRTTREDNTDVTPKPDDTKKAEQTARFAAVIGLYKKYK